jgi:hypothetical protein
MSSIITFTYCSKWNHLIYKGLSCDHFRLLYTVWLNRMYIVGDRDRGGLTEIGYVPTWQIRGEWLDLEARDGVDGSLCLVHSIVSVSLLLRDSWVSYKREKHTVHRNEYSYTFQYSFIMMFMNKQVVRSIHFHTCITSIGDFQDCCQHYFPRRCIPGVNTNDQPYVRLTIHDVWTFTTLQLSSVCLSENFDLSVFGDGPCVKSLSGWTKHSITCTGFPQKLDTSQHQEYDWSRGLYWQETWLLSTINKILMNNLWTRSFWLSVNCW